MKNFAQIRHVLGVICVYSAILALLLALVTDLAIFQYDHSSKLTAFIDRHDGIAVRALECAAYISLTSLIASFFADGWRRAVGISVSLATLLICSPLGAGY